MSQAGYDDAREFWDKRYGVPEYIFGEAPNAFLAAARSRFCSGMRVLDIACGEGRNSVWLAQQGCRVTGVDISPLALAKARALATARGVDIVVAEADLTRWTWPEANFDAVVSIFIQFAAPEGRAQLFERMMRALVPGGFLMLQGFTPAQLRYSSGGPKEVSHLYTKAMLGDLLKGFEVEHLEEHEAVLDEGSKHSGQAALIDLIARKPA